MNRNIQQDQANSADLNSVKLVEGDLICLATDGLWDNLDERDLLKLLKKKFQVNNSLSLFGIFFKYETILRLFTL